MTHPHTALKVSGDVGASIAGAIVAASHWAEIITPILSLFIAIATAVWWSIRFVEIWKTGRTGE